MRRQREREAFTMIEMMIVILIIAVMVSMLAGAVVKVLGKIPQVQTSTDIAQLSLALQAFQTDFQLSDPPPSYLVLSEDITWYTNPANPNSVSNNPQGPVAKSFYFLLALFGRNTGTPKVGSQIPTYIDWNGDGITPNGPWTLEGDQCLVFYTGGIPNTQQIAAGFTPQPQGFSLNPTNPALPGGKRKGPYMNFDSTRLVVRSTTLPGVPGTLPGTSGGFFSYYDAWRVKTGPQPYAYFSSQGIMNNYSLTDCLSIKAAPYFMKPGQYNNPTGCQIISAGKDGLFGTTGWDPSSGVIGPGADDQSNFSASLLGAGMN